MSANNEKIPIKLSSISIAGNDRTSLHFFQSELGESLSSCEDLGKLHVKLTEATERLLGRNMFEVVDSEIRLDSVSEGVYDTSVILKVKEKGFLQLKGSSYLKTDVSSSSDVCVEIEGALRNPIGYGEMLKASTARTQSDSREMLSSLQVPHFSPWKGNLQISARTGEENQAYFTSYKQKKTSLTIDYASMDTKHKLTAEFSLRDEIPILDGGSRPVSPATILSAAASIKSSLKYAFTLVDDRDSATSPSTGKLLQGSVEAAMPPGNAQFFRSEFQSQYHRTIGPSVNGQVGLVASICASAGIIYPLQRLNFLLPQDGNSKYRTYLSDKYQLGGPLSLRGFEVAGVGARAYSPLSESPGRSAVPVRFHHVISNPAYSPNQATDLGDSMGGDCKSSFLFALSVPMVWPVKGSKDRTDSDSPEGGSTLFPNLRAFAFLNAGSLGNSSYWTLSSLALANSKIPQKPAADDTGPSTTISSVTNGTTTTTTTSSTAAVAPSSSSSSSSPSPSSSSPPFSFNGLVSYQGRSIPLLGFLRASVGVGMSLSLSNAVRLEACYSLPVLYSPQDNLRAAQLGVGLTVN